MALQSYIDQYPHLQNLTGTALETGLLNMIQQNNGLTNSEMIMIRYYKYFSDGIVTYIDYPGDSVKITVEDPDTHNLTDFGFGAPILRESTMIYANGGYYHTYGDDPANPTSIIYKNAGYEGVRSFAIVTTKVTDDILQYWLDQKDKKDANGSLVYANGPMKAAYGAFLSSLIMIKCHDMIADQAAAQYNVTWTRTTPIIVSVFDDAYRTVITLECDHRFGMDVTGETGNVTAFRYACSSAINPLEHYVMKTLFPGGNGTSIVMGLGKELFNGLMPSMFMSNGYLVMRSTDNSLFLIFDPETGILRDVMILNGTVSGEYCLSDLQTEWIHNLGNMLSNHGTMAMYVNPSWLPAIAESAINFGGYLSEFAANMPGLFSAYVPEVVAAVLAASVYVPPVFCIVAGAVVGYCIFQYCVDQGWLPPERCREIIGTAFPVPFGIVNKLFYGDDETSKYHYKQQSDANEKIEETKKKIKDGQIGGGDSDSSKLILIMAIASIPGVITYKTFEPIIKSNSTWLYNWIQSQLNSSTNNSTNGTGGFNGTI